MLLLKFSLTLEYFKLILDNLMFQKFNVFNAKLQCGEMSAVLPFITITLQETS